MRFLTLILCLFAINILTAQTEFVVQIGAYEKEVNSNHFQGIQEDVSFYKDYQDIIHYYIGRKFNSKSEAQAFANNLNYASFPNINILDLGNLKKCGPCTGPQRRGEEGAVPQSYDVSLNVDRESTYASTPTTHSTANTYQVVGHSNSSVPTSNSYQVVNRGVANVSGANTYRVVGTQNVSYPAVSNPVIQHAAPVYGQVISAPITTNYPIVQNAAPIYGQVVSAPPVATNYPVIQGAPIYGQVVSAPVATSYPIVQNAAPIYGQVISAPPVNNYPVISTPPVSYPVVSAPPASNYSRTIISHSRPKSVAMHSSVTTACGNIPAFPLKEQQDYEKIRQVYLATNASIYTLPGKKTEELKCYLSMRTNSLCGLTSSSKKEIKRLINCNTINSSIYMIDSSGTVLDIDAVYKNIVSGVSPSIGMGH